MADLHTSPYDIFAEANLCDEPGTVREFSLLLRNISGGSARGNELQSHAVALKAVNPSCSLEDLQAADMAATIIQRLTASYSFTANGVSEEVFEAVKQGRAVPSVELFQEILESITQVPSSCAANYLANMQVPTEDCVLLYTVYETEDDEL